MIHPLGSFIVITNSHHKTYIYTQLLFFYIDIPSMKTYTEEILLKSVSVFISNCFRSTGEHTERVFSEKENTNLKKTLRLSRMIIESSWMTYVHNSIHAKRFFCLMLLTIFAVVSITSSTTCTCLQCNQPKKLFDHHSHSDRAICDNHNGVSSEH